MELLALEDRTFDDLVAQIPQALDEAGRADLYKQAQAILQDQVPMINFLINTAVAGESSNVDGIALNLGLGPHHVQERVLHRVTRES